MNRNFHKKKKTKNTVVNYFGGKFVALEIISKKEQTLTTTEKLSVSPTMIFYGNDNTKVLFDYKGSTNEDLIKLKNLFGSMSSGATFSVESGSANYLNERSTKIDADVSGVYGLSSFQGDVVYADVVSIASFNSYEKTYSSKYFLDSIKLKKTTVEKSSKKLFQIINHSGIHSNFSFRFARPILKNDIVEISTPLNRGKYKIESYHISNGIEYLTISEDGDPLVEENLIGSSILVSLYRSNYGYKYMSSKQREEVSAIRTQNNTENETSGVCCLYANERIEDQNTGHTFKAGDLVLCSNNKDWECVSNANSIGYSYKFVVSSDETYKNCNGYMVFRGSPDDSIEDHCYCCPSRVIDSEPEEVTTIVPVTTTSASIKNILSTKTTVTKSVIKKKL